jgi:subtilisin-like proprotein convertase family protein
MLLLGRIHKIFGNPQPIKNPYKTFLMKTPYPTLAFLLTCFLISYSTVQAQPCGCTDCPLPLNDNATLQSAIEVLVDGPNDLGDCPLEQVCLTIEHTWIGDLSVSLISPSGVHYLVMADANNNFGGCGSDGDNIDICIETGTGNPLTNNTEYICNGSPADCLTGNWTLPCGGVTDPVSGALQAPNCDLDDFNVPGAAANGVWTLVVNDLCAADIGFLMDWSLSFACGEINCESVDPPEPIVPGTGINGCAEAPILCGESELDLITGTLSPTGVGIVPPQFCGSAENYHWYGFVAGSPTISLEIIPSNCAGTPNGSGLQAMMFGTDDCENFEAVSDCESPGVAIPIILNALVIPGNTYYVMIDGWAGDECAYELNLLEGQSACTPITFTSNCAGDTAFISLTTPPEGDCTLDWTVDASVVEILSGQGSSNLEIAWIADGPTNICVTSDPDCPDIIDLCYEVVVQPVDTTQVTLELCPGTFVEFNSEIYTEAGEYLVELEQFGCNSYVELTIELLPEPVLVDEGMSILCYPNCLEFYGETYCESGLINQIASSACDSLFQIDLTILRAEPEITVLQEFPCSFNPIPGILDASNSLLEGPPDALIEYLWEGPGILSDPTEIEVEINQAGIYSLSLTITYEGVTCTQSATLQIEEVDYGSSLEETICEGETFELNGTAYNTAGIYTQELSTTNGCDSLVTLDLTVVETETQETSFFLCPGDTIQWNGLTLSETGTYSTLLEIPGTSCTDTSILNLIVTSAITLDNVEILPDNGSNQGAIYPTFTNGVPPYSYAWSTGDTGAELTELSIGDYAVTVTDNLGCAQVFAFTVGFLSGTQGAALTQDLRIRPNPVGTSGDLWLELLLPVTVSPVIRLYHTNGREVPVVVEEVQQGEWRLRAPQAAGLYLLSVEANGHQWIRKIIVQ